MIARALIQAKQGGIAARHTTTGNAIKLLTLHRIAMHPSWKATRKMFGLPANGPNPTCDECEKAKAKWMGVPETARYPPAETIVSRQHLDVVFARLSKFMWQQFCDDYSRKMWMSPLTSKSDSLNSFLDHKARIENQRYPLKIAYVRTDNENIYTTEG